MPIPDTAGIKMMQLFRERERRSGFLTSLFSVIPGSTGSTAESVMWDIKRYDDQIADPITPGAGVNMNTHNKWSSRELIPCRFSEGIPINVNTLIHRLAGENPFDAANREFTSRFIDRANEGLVAMARKLERSVELMAAQILQTGQINLTGAVSYTQNFVPKATHFPTVGTPWSDSVNSTPIDDVESLCNVVQVDSKAECAQVLMGRTAFREFTKSDQVQEMADLRRVNMIDVKPEQKNRGAKRFGNFQAGEYSLDIWTYSDVYEPSGGGAKTPYLDEDSVVVLPDDPGLVVASTRVPRVLKADPRVAGLVSVPTTAEAGWDLVPNIWCDPSGDNIYAAWYASVVLIPQEIDGFGCLST